jgi:hypothetical protein
MFPGPARRGTEFDEAGFFRAISLSGARALLIGRKALVVLGLPVLTGDYDFWVHPDDAATFNAAAKPFGLSPTRSPEEARKRGRYVLENDEKIDVLVARAVSTVDGMEVIFEDVWNRRRSIPTGPGIELALPELDDLIATKRFAARPKDAEDIRLLEGLRDRQSGEDAS